jgi:MTH538 TIR-like domain (DUF1863)
LKVASAHCGTPHPGWSSGFVVTSSFLFKGWAITIAAALSAFAEVNTKRALLAIALVMTVLFWALDGYCLWLEYGLVRLYKLVSVKDEPDIDFSIQIDRSNAVRTETASRPWVDYEMEKSIEKGNGLIGVRIHWIKDQTGRRSDRGPTPAVLTHDGVRVYDWDRNNFGRWVEWAIDAGKDCYKHKKTDCFACSRHWWS